MDAALRVWSQDEEHVVASLGSFCVNAYTRPYRHPDILLFREINCDMWKRFPLVSSLCVVETTGWSLAELRMLRDETTRDELTRLREELPTSGTHAIVCVGSGLASAFTRSLVYGFNFISRSRRAGMFTELREGLDWLQEAAMGQQAYPGSERIKEMLDGLNHSALRMSDGGKNRGTERIRTAE